MSQKAQAPRSQFEISSKVSPEVNGTNAADLFKNAFVLYDQLTEEEKNILNHPREEIDEAKAEALFKRIQPILALLREAAKADYCDWGMGEMKFDQPATLLTKGSQLAKLSLWAAGYQFSSDPGAALDGLADRGELGRALGGNALIGLLVETSMERSASELIRQNAALITPELAAQYKDLLQNSTLQEDAGRAMKAELEGYNNELNKLKAEAPADGGAGEEAVRATAQSPEAKAKFEQVKQFEQEFPLMLKASDEQFNQWMERVKQASAANEYLQANDIFSSTRDRIKQATLERTMLGAGIEVLQNGPSTLNAYPEPGSSAALQYNETPDGFELQSRTQFKGKPLIMRFKKSGTN